MENKPVIWSFWGHEPLRHLRRMGNDGASIFSLGEWVDDWYNHIHSEQMVKRASEAGINTIYTHFFKGFGLEAEKEEMENTKKLCSIAHKYGIKVLGYCQLGSLYSEVLTKEIPNLEDIAIRDADGSLSCWLKQYYRLRPCFNSSEFMAYIKKVIEYGLDHVGLDGFHFDNSYNVPCYCDKCKKAFREYLTKNVPDPLNTLGIDSFDYVQIPYIDTDRETHDVLYMYYLQYKADLCARVQNEVFSYAKEKGAKVVLHNPVFPRGGEYFTYRGFEPSKNSKACDYVFAENPDFIRFENGKIITQIEAFKYGELFGYKVFDTCWRYDENNLATLSDKYSDTSRFLAQSMIFGGVCGSPQTIRSLKDGHKNMLEDSNLFEVLKHMYSYYQNNIDVFSGKEHNNVKILYYPLNCMFARGYGMKTLSDCVNEAIGSQIPFSIITENDIANLTSNDVLVLPHISYAKNNLVDLVTDAQKRGVKVYQVERFATYNENGKERAKSHSVFANDFIKSSNNIGADIKDLIKENQIISSHPDVIVETRKLANGKLVLHVLCTDNEIPKDITLNIFGFSLNKFTYISSENAVAEKLDETTIKISGIQTTVSIIFE